MATVTGDAEAVANSLARRLGIDEVFAEVLPQDKGAQVSRLQGAGYRAAMVGAGTDVAIASAGVVLASDDPRSVSSVIELSRATYRKMVQNLW